MDLHVKEANCSEALAYRGTPRMIQGNAALLRVSASG